MLDAHLLWYVTHLSDRSAHAYAIILGPLTGWHGANYYHKSQVSFLCLLKQSPEQPSLTSSFLITLKQTNNRSLGCRHVYSGDTIGSLNHGLDLSAPAPESLFEVLLFNTSYYHSQS